MKADTPYDFIFDYLPDNIIVRKLFGMHYVYFNKKNILILRKAPGEKNLNGIWLATVQTHHASLSADLPGIIALMGDKPGKKDSAWMCLEESNDHFETIAIRLCDLICRGDARIGVVTKKSVLLSLHYTRNA